LIAKGQPIADGKSGSRRNLDVVTLGAAATRLLGRFLRIVRGSRFGAEGGRQDRGVDALRGLGLGALFTPRAATTAGGTCGALFGGLALLGEQFGGRRFLCFGLMAIGIAVAAVWATVAAAFARFTVRARLTILTRLAILAGFAVRTCFTILAGLAVLTRLAIIAITAGFLPRLALVARLALLRTIVTLLLLVAAIAFAFVIEIIVVTVDVVARTGLRTLIRIRLLEARAGFAQHPEIMVGELEIIFGVDPIALHLRIASKVLVFLEQLRGVTAGAIVDAVAIALVGAATLALLTTTAATAAVVSLTIVHQGLYVLST
jgi:hypothetical protein